MKNRSHRSTLAALALGAGLAFAPSAHAQNQKVSVIGAQMVHSDKLPTTAEWPAMMQVLVNADFPNKFDIVNAGDCCSSVSLTYPTQPETHPYLKPPNKAQFRPGYPTSITPAPNVVIIAPWGKHDRELNVQVFHNMLSQDQYAADYETMIKTYEDLPTHPKMFACLPIPIPAGAATGVVNDVILPATKSVLARHPEVTVIDMWTPFLNHPNLFKDANDTSIVGGSHVTDNEGLHLIANTVYPVFKAAMMGTGGTPTDAATTGGDDAATGGTPDADVAPADAAPSGTGGAAGSGGGSGTGGSGGTGGTPGTGGGGAGGTGGEPTVVDAGSPSGSGGGPPRKRGGCSYGGSHSGDGALALGLICLGAVMVARRRRS